MKDLISFILGLLLGRKQGGKHVVLDEANNYTFTDANNDGNIVIEEAE